jgi:hypothetical protein
MKVLQQTRAMEMNAVAPAIISQGENLAEATA